MPVNILQVKDYTPLPTLYNGFSGLSVNISPRFVKFRTKTYPPPPDHQPPSPHQKKGAKLDTNKILKNLQNCERRKFSTFPCWDIITSECCNFSELPDRNIFRNQTSTLVLSLIKKSQILTVLLTIIFKFSKFFPKGTQNCTKFFFDIFLKTLANIFTFFHDLHVCPQQFAQIFG